MGSFVKQLLAEGWIRARVEGGCPVCGQSCSGNDPDRDKCLAAPAETVTVGSTTHQNPEGWKVLCASSRMHEGKPGADAGYVYDSTSNKGALAVHQYILREIWERLEAGKDRAASGGVARHVHARRGGKRAAGGQKHQNRLEREDRPQGPDGENAERAAEIWASSQPWSPELDAYITARGRGAGLLKGVIEGATRFHPACPFVEEGVDQRQTPAVVMKVTNTAGELVGVHRIAVEPDGSAKSSVYRNCKKLLGGAVQGAAIRIPASAMDDGVLIVCEGPETGWAIAQATERRVDVSVSTSGLSNYAITRNEVLQGIRPDLRVEGEPFVHTVVIAADVDVSLAGQRFAREAASMLRASYPGLKVGIAWISADADGSPLTTFDPDAVVRHDWSPGEWVPAESGRKSVDFEDVANECGEATLRDLIDFAVQGATPALSADQAIGVPSGIDDTPPIDLRTASEGDDDDRLLPEQSSRVVFEFVSQVFGSVDPDRESGATYRLVFCRDKWWERRAGCWRELDESALRGVFRRWLETRLVEKMIEIGEGDDGKPKKEKRLIAFRPTDRQISEYIAAAKGELYIRPPLQSVMSQGVMRKVERIPFYLEPTYSRVGQPMRFSDDPSRRSVSDDEAEQEGLMPLDRSIMFANGVMSQESLLAGEPEITPHNERLFATSMVPLAWPHEATVEIRKGSIEGWLEDRCPHFRAHLKRIDDYNRGAADAIMRHHGAAFAGRNDDQTALWLHGPAGSGKSTLLDALMDHLGDAALPGLSLAKIAKQEYQSQIEGKRAIVFGDAEGGSVDQLEVGEVLKQLISGDPLQARELFQRRPIEFRFTGRAWFGSNRIFKVRDPGDAFGKRLVFVGFPDGVRGTSKQTPAYARRIRSEAVASMVMSIWCGTREYLRSVESGGVVIPRPTLHAESMEIFGQLSNELSRFVDQHIVAASSFTDASGHTETPWITVERLRDAFCAFCGVDPADSKIRSPQVSADFKAEMNAARYLSGKRWLQNGPRGFDGSPGDGRPRRTAAYEHVRFAKGSLDELFGDEAPTDGMWPHAETAWPDGLNV